MKRFFIVALAIVAMSSCNKTELYTETQEQIAAQFTSSEIATRTSGDSWIDGDRVGISMYSNGDITTPLAENYEYSSDASGNFTEQRDPIYYPASGTVDFYAYYPYQSVMSDNIYLADISDQSDIGAIDFMIATLSDVSKSSLAQKLYFNHSLAMIELNVTLKKSLLTIEGAKVEIQGMNTTASIDILTGAIVEGTSDDAATLEMVTVEDDATAEGYVEALTATLIVLPETMGADVKLVFTLTSGEVLSASLSGEEFVGGAITSYDVAVGYDEITFFGSTLEPWSEIEEDDKLVAQEVN